MWQGLHCLNSLHIEVKTMKELYLDAEMEVVKFSVEDVIATSRNIGGLGGENEGEMGDADGYL
jgi:hypothetical protein